MNSTRQESKHATLTMKEKLHQEFLSAVEEKDLPKMMRVQKKIDAVLEEQKKGQGNAKKT